MESEEVSILSVYEVLDKILGNLSIKQLIAIQIVCKTFYNIIREPSTLCYYLESHGIIITDKKFKSIITQNLRECFYYVNCIINCKSVVKFLNLELETRQECWGIENTMPLIIDSYEQIGDGRLYYLKPLKVKFCQIHPEQKDISITIIWNSNNILQKETLMLQDYYNRFSDKSNNGDRTIYFPLYYYDYYDFEDTEHLEYTPVHLERIYFRGGKRDIWKYLSFNYTNREKEDRIEWPKNNNNLKNMMNDVFGFNPSIYHKEYWSKYLDALSTKLYQKYSKQF